MALIRPIQHRRPSLGHAIARRSAAAAIFVLASVGVSAAGASTGHQVSKALVKSGPVTLLGESCGAKALEARVTIPRLVFAPAQAVTVRATVRNVSTAPCRFVGFERGPTTIIGPCNSLSMEIKNSAGTNVWPGTGAFNCPMLTSVSLRPGGHFATSGAWNQETVINPHQVPPGHYRLIVGGSLSFSITIS